MAASAGGGDAAGGEHGDRQLAGLGDLDDQFVRGLQFLGGYVQFVLAQRGQPADLAADGAHVSGGVGDVSGACFTLRADHGRAFVDATERFAEVGGATDEGSGELPLVDVVGVVGRGQDLGLVDVGRRRGSAGSALRRSDRLRALAMTGMLTVEMMLSIMSGSLMRETPPCARMSAGNPLECHDGDGACVFGDLGLLKR